MHGCLTYIHLGILLKICPSYILYRISGNNWFSCFLGCVYTYLCFMQFCLDYSSLKKWSLVISLSRTRSSHRSIWKMEVASSSMWLSQMRITSPWTSSLNKMSLNYSPWNLLCVWLTVHPFLDKLAHDFCLAQLEMPLYILPTETEQNEWTTQMLHQQDWM